MIADRAERLGDRTAVVVPDSETISYGDLADRAARTARGLVTLGIAPGDRVATMLPS